MRQVIPPAIPLVAGGEGPGGVWGPVHHRETKSTTGTTNAKHAEDTITTPEPMNPLLGVLQLAVETETEEKALLGDLKIPARISLQRMVRVFVYSVERELFVRYFSFLLL